MNVKTLHLPSLLLLLACYPATAQILADNFNGTSINSALWSTYNTPTGNSSVTEGGGNVTFVNGAGLLTASGYNNATISGSFEFTGDTDDQFGIYLRSDGTTFDPHWNDLRSGVLVQFAASSNPSGIASLWIADASTSPYTILEQATPTINMNTFYNFTITDSGGEISVYFNNSTTPTLTAQTTLSAGNTIGIFDRQQLDVGGPQHQTTLDYISIASVPEPSVAALFTLAGFGTLLIRRR
jgi:hypothetical protein